MPFVCIIPSTRNARQTQLNQNCMLLMYRGVGQHYQSTRLVARVRFHFFARARQMRYPQGATERQCVSVLPREAHLDPLLIRGLLCAGKGPLFKSQLRREAPDGRPSVFEFALQQHQSAGQVPGPRARRAGESPEVARWLAFYSFPAAVPMDGPPAPTPAPPPLPAQPQRSRPQ